MRFGAREIIFSANSYGAAILALYLALVCDLDKPYWAMMTAYVTAQPFSGALHSKALFRLIGTVLGATAMVLAIPTFSNVPILLSLVIAGWVGLCLFFSLLDRTPRAYVFLLAGYTTAFIGFPIVGAPATAFDVAVARGEEICIGVLCATTFHTIFFPRSLRQTLAGRFAETMDDLKAWCTDTLVRKMDSIRRRGRIRLAADITDLHMMATHVPFDTHEPQQFGAVISAVEEKFIRLFPVISGLSDRFKRLEQTGGLPPKLGSVLADIATWMRAPTPMASTAALQEKCQNLMQLGSKPSWRDMLLFNVAARLTELITTYAACRDLVAKVGNREALRATDTGEGLRIRVLHTDRRSALYSALACAGIVFLGCVLWIVSGWQDGGTAVMMGTVTYCLFASQANPVPAQKGSLYNTALASLVAGIYLFLIFPHTHSFATMAITLAPVLLISGVLLGSPGGIKYMSFVIPFCGSLTLTRHFAPDFQLFLNWNAAQFVGIAGAVAATRILHRFSAHRRIQSVLSATALDIGQIANGTKVITTNSWLSLMVDRIGLLAPYVDIIKSSDRYKTVNAMLDLRTGLNVISLIAATDQLTQEGGLQNHALLLMIGDHFSAQGREGVSLTPALGMLGEIDGAIASATSLPANRLKESVINALTGLRCNLFPQALEYRC
jgi:uncharacterized membrane protein YccC